MKKKPILMTWLGLFVLCAGLGFIPEVRGFGKFLCVAASVAFFIPGGMLLKQSYDRSDWAAIRLVRNLAITSLASTVVVFALNVCSAFLPEIWGNISYGLLIVVSSPMICARYWVLSLFGWACLMYTAIALLRKRKR